VPLNGVECRGTGTGNSTGCGLDTAHETTRNWSFHSGQLSMVLEFAKESEYSYICIDQWS
jgi:hypothetical protein